MNMDSKIALAIIYFILGIVILIFAFAIWHKSYYILRDKGYDPLQSLVICITGAMVSIAGLFIVMRLRLVSVNHLDFILTLFTIPALVNWLVARLARPVKKRMPGARRSKFPYKNVSYIAVFILAVTFALLYPWFKSVLKDRVWELAIKYFLLPGIFIYHFFKSKYNLLRKPNIEPSLGSDRRLPVLYIRSFKHDFDPFFIGNIYRKGIHKQLSEDLLLFQQQGIVKPIPLQQFLYKSFEKKIGLLIGLGNPEDTVPLEGMTSSYYADENWQNEFMAWGRLARCIVISPAETKGLIFELETIHGCRWQKKFFIFSKPVRWWGYRLFMPLIQWTRNIKPVKWEQFAAKLNDIGFRVQTQPPLPGTIITFNDEFEQVVVRTNAITPDDFVNAIANHLGVQYSAKKEE